MTSGAAKTEDRSHPTALRGYLLLLTATLFWGGAASIAKILFMNNYETLIIIQTRSTLSFLLLVLFFLVRDRTVFRIPRRMLYKFAIVGVVGIALTNYTYYYTIRESSVATAILIQNTAPVLVMLYSVLVSKEEAVNGLKILSLALALIGCYVAVTGGASLGIAIPTLALISGIASSVCFAFILIASKKVLKDYSVWTTLIYLFGFAALFWLFINPPWVIVSHGYSGQDWGIFLAFAIVSILIPHSLFMTSMKYLQPTNAGITSIMEPVFAILIAYLVLGEKLTMVQTAGACGVVAAILLLQIAPTMLRVVSPAKASEKS